MTEEQLKQKEEKHRKAQEARALSEYKKNLRENVEVKRLQVEELELNVRFYHAKKAWIEIQDEIPKIEEAEAQMIAKAKKEEYERQQKIKQMVKEAEEKEKADKEKEKPKAEKKEKPKITPVKQGQPRK